MKIRKDFFYYFAVLVYIFCMLFAIVCVFNRMGEGQEYPYLIKGTWLIGAFMFLFLLMAVWALWARLGITEKMNRHPKLALILELMAAAVIVIFGAYLRYRVIAELPMAPESDYKTYYEMAVMIHDGTLLEEGVGFCDYVAMFPHVYGYPAVLSWFFGIFGVSVHTAEIFNLIISIGSLILVWGIARLLRGRFAALVALVMWSLLPSAILYSDFVASEPLFTFILLWAVLFFVMSMRKTQRKEKHPWFCTIELVLMGVVLAFCAFIRPMAMIFLVAAMICMLPMERGKYDIPTNDVPLGVRAVDAGWKRCLIVLIVYFGCSKLFTMATSYAVDRELAGSSASFGYNLLVGLNLESYGGWNQEDADYLYDAFEATGSAQEAQMVCRDMAFERLKADPYALINLFVHKFDVLWGNDDYGASWNILFMDQQDNLTPEREDFLYRMMDISDLVYLLMLLEAGIFGFVMFRLRPDALYSCVLLILGTAALHLFVENQNRYHYHALPFLAILAGAAGAAMRERVGVAVMARIEEKKRLKAAEEERIAHVRKLQKEEEERVRLRAEALHAQFDMAKAIEEGHIRIVASKAIEGAYAPKPAEKPSEVGKDEHIISEKSGSSEPQEAEVLTVSELEKRAASEELSADDKVPEPEELSADDKVSEPEASSADDKVSEPEELPADDKVPESEESSADDKVTESEELPADDKVTESEELPADDKVTESEELSADDKVPEPEELPADNKVPESEDSFAEDKIPEPEELSADNKVPEPEELPAEDMVPESEETSAEDKVPEPEELSAEDKVPEPEESSADDKVTEPEELPADDKVSEPEESSADDKVPESEESSAEEMVPESEETSAEDMAPESEESSDDDKVPEPEELSADNKVPESEETSAEDKVLEPEESSADDKVFEPEELSADNKVPESEESSAEDMVPESEESPADDKVSDGSSEDSSENPNNESEG